MYLIQNDGKSLLKLALDRPIGKHDKAKDIGLSFSTTSIVHEEAMVPKKICIEIAAEIDKIVIAIGIESLSGRNIARGGERSSFSKSGISRSIIHHSSLVSSC